MTEKNGMRAVIIAGMLIIFSVISYIYMTSAKTSQRHVNLSVVVYGSTAEKWTSFKQGVEQAASDLDASVNFVVLSGTNDAKEQEEQMERELENGAEGMVVAVTDSRGMADYITRTANVSPIVLVESGIYGDESLPCVAANAYEMGKELAGQVIEGTGADVPVYIVQTGENRNCQKERLAGFRDGCEKAGRKVEQVLYPNQEAMKEVLESEKEQALAALDDLPLAMTMNVVGGSRKNLKIYGIGSSEQIVFGVDQGLIEGIVFQNEFNMGYEAVDILVQKIRKGGALEPMAIDFHKATGETLHEPENERLLYPLIQ